MKIPPAGAPSYSMCMYGQT